MRNELFEILYFVHNNKIITFRSDLGDRFAQAALILGIFYVVLSKIVAFEQWSTVAASKICVISWENVVGMHSIFFDDNILVYNKK